ncbi:conjugal transfer protein [Streptomyces sp. NPDC026665]|uniref:conjugal transfer protein n=1 Tax=Streptomyces sp. NPDC026665 TaxID=3154798 RepID=UPI0033CB3E87
MTTRSLTRGQTFILGAAAVIMVAVGTAGAIGTYANVVSKFQRKATAVGAVSAGEGLTLIFALTMLGLTMLGQPSPTWVRVGLWLAPLGACGTGLSLASNATELVVYGLTPLGMSGAAEGLGLVARRIVIYTTGVDADAQRRQADTVQELAYHQAAAERHPDEEVRESSLRQAWKLAAKVGRGDGVLGSALVDVQRTRITGGADTALGAMYGAPVPAGVEEPPARVRPATATEVLRERFAEMDPEDAIKLAHDARPDATPAELAHLLGTYGLPVDAVAVALALGRRAPEYDVHRPDARDARQVSELEPLDLQGAVEEAASVLGPDASAREIVDRLRRERRLVATEAYVRTALSRAAKKSEPEPQPEPPAKPMEGGYN